MKRLQTSNIDALILGVESSVNAGVVIFGQVRGEVQVDLWKSLVEAFNCGIPILLGYVVGEHTERMTQRNKTNVPSPPAAMRRVSQFSASAALYISSRERDSGVILAFHCAQTDVWKHATSHNEKLGRHICFGSLLRTGVSFCAEQDCEIKSHDRLYGYDVQLTPSQTCSRCVTICNTRWD